VGKIVGQLRNPGNVGNEVGGGGRMVQLRDKTELLSQKLWNFTYIHSDEALWNSDAPTVFSDGSHYPY
jgi:hypothetical protein